MSRIIARLVFAIALLSSALIAGASGVGALNPAHIIAYERDVGGTSHSRISFVDLGTCAIRRVTLPLKIWSMRWSPDKSQLALIGIGAAGTFASLYTLSWDGFHLYRLAHVGLTLPTALSWSPDSQRIYYAIPPSAVLSNRFEVQIVNVSTLEVQGVSQWSASETAIFSANFMEHPRDFDPSLYLIMAERSRAGDEFLLLRDHGRQLHIAVQSPNSPRRILPCTLPTTRLVALPP